MHGAVLRTHENVCRMGNSLISPKKAEATFFPCQFLLFRNLWAFSRFQCRHRRLLRRRHHIIFGYINKQTGGAHNFIFISIETSASLLLCSLSTAHPKICMTRVFLPERNGKNITYTFTVENLPLFSFCSIKKDEMEIWFEFTSTWECPGSGTNMCENIYDESNLIRKTKAISDAFYIKLN